jgi:hypothetical protein
MARFKRASIPVLVTVLLSSLSAFAASPPKAGCRPVSKLEHNISKKDNQLGWQIRSHGTILESYLLALFGLVREGQHGAMAGRRSFSDGCSLSALDGANSDWHPAGLVCLRVRHTSRSLKQA